jgi:hypothetical protein
MSVVLHEEVGTMREILAKTAVGPRHDHIADPALPSVAGPANAFHHS